MATTSTFAHINKAISLAGFCPEVSHGNKNVKLEASGGSTTTITVTTAGSGRDDANLANAPADFFNDAVVYWINGAMAGTVYNVTDFAFSDPTATFTVDTMSGTPSSGDDFFVFFPMPVENFSMSPETEDLPRDFHRLSLDPPSSVKGLEKSSGSCDLEFPGLSTTLGNGATAALDRTSQIMLCLGSRRAYAGTTVSGSGSTTTVVDVNDASNFAVDDMVMIGGEVARITAIDTASTPDNITLTPALASAPADTTEVYGAEVITPQDTGQRTCTWLWYQDDRLVETQGNVLNFGLSGEFGQKAIAQLDWDGEEFLNEDAVSLDGTQLDKQPIPYVTGRAYFGSTQLQLNSFEFDLGQGRAELRDTEAGIRHFVRERRATLKMVFRDVNVTPIETWQSSGTKQRCLLQIGNTAGNTIAIEGWCMIGDPIATADVGETQYWDATFFFFDDQTSQTMTKPRIARF